MHQGNSPAQKGASSSYVEQGWDSLTDDQLLRVRWSTDDPLSLPNLQTAIPADLGEFQIELAYDLTAEDAAVPCAHCPQHQKHRHGFVLRDDQDRRYLLGSTCGPKAYGSDYRIASNARGRAKRRYDLLTRWIALRDDLPDQIQELAGVAASGLARVLRSGRRRLEQEAPRTVDRLRQLRPSGNGSQLRLTQVREERDDAAEEAVMAGFLAEVRKLTDLGLPNREHNRRHAELRDRLGAGKPIIRVVETDHGTLTGADWIRFQQCPTDGLTDAVTRLRGLAAIGQTTQDIPTSRLSQIVRQADADLERSEQFVAAILGSRAFFDPVHLAAVCEWLNGGINPPGRCSSSGSKWQVTESRRDTVAVDLSPAIGIAET